MMAVAGILGTEILGVTPAWFEAGSKDYGFPNAPLLAIEAVIMGFLETKRLQGFKSNGTVRPPAHSLPSLCSSRVLLSPARGLPHCAKRFASWQRLHTSSWCRCMQSMSCQSSHQ
jgi:hypothetical protein